MIETVKKVLGVLELALAVKFISNADIILGIGVINRDVVLVLWALASICIVLFLSGKISIFGKKFKKLSLGRATWSLFFTALSFYFLLGLGRPLDGWIEAYLPIHLDEQNQQTKDSLHWLKSPEEGLKVAKQLNQLVFIDFTGYTCVNCRWMEKNIFPQPKIKKALEKNFALVKLYTDGGKDYQKWQQMQIQRFQTVALPFYVILTAQNEVVATKTGLVSDVEEFFEFLQSRPQKK